MRQEEEAVEEAGQVPAVEDGLVPGERVTLILEAPVEALGSALAKRKIPIPNLRIQNSNGQVDRQSKLC